MVDVIDLFDTAQYFYLLLGVGEQQLYFIPRVDEKVLINLVLLYLIVIVADSRLLRYDASTVPYLLEDICILPRVVLRFQ